ncbi:carbohydrate ABC transporter substrate-binding protein, CUT1 family [Tistlia consotensis]|uniref:Carbohydrate ABC transporter substrate-binding protein, CUT1 family n=1 Tax=Tistlia consotensis USBA 355 TaxID=560819 RepID=A0A1Y6B3M6_9PROT|nr:ABC transporter substrate-binding protein [Tistlia consotensis]SME89807.1 carbohydrate ABC transporter substrate-binding protein, CUT1 family [Tistlia consotensis USBA 355]SNR26312.1 carbohydrate ABC transporter substrate-binding protein, CUT1 family [Tistlia consotensis]
MQLLSLRGLATAGLAASVALGAGLAAAQAKTEIEMFFPVPVEGKLAKEMQSLIERFNEAHPEIKATAVYTGSYDETNLKTRAAIKAGRPPAAVIMSANFILEYQLNDEIQPLDPLIEADGKTPDAFMGQFWQALHGNAQFAGKVWAVPFQNSTPLLYINATQFRAAGLDPDHPPATWAEWLAAAEKLTKREGGETKRWGLMIPENYDYLGWIMTALTMSNGGLYYNPEYGGEVYYDAPTMLGALSFVDELAHKAKVMPAAITDGKAVSTAFFAGQASMVVLSTGSLSFVRENMKDDYRVAFVPRNLRNAVAIGGASLMMPKGLSPEKQKAAWTLMKWLTSPEIAGQWSRFTGYFAPNKAAYDLPEMKQFIDSHPDAKVALDQLKYARSWFATYNTVAVRKALEDQVQAVITGDAKPAEALKAAQQKADELMKPYVDSTALKLPAAM